MPAKAGIGEWGPGEAGPGAEGGVTTGVDFGGAVGGWLVGAGAAADGGGVTDRPGPEVGGTPDAASGPPSLGGAGGGGVTLEAVAAGTGVAGAPMSTVLANSNCFTLVMSAWDSKGLVTKSLAPARSP